MKEVRLPSNKTLNKYGLSKAGWLEIFTEQGFLCAMCGKKEFNSSSILDGKIVCFGCRMSTVWRDDDYRAREIAKRNSPESREKRERSFASDDVRNRLLSRPSSSQRYESVREQIASGGNIPCAICGKVKSLDDFPKSRKKRNGQPRYAYCKQCHSAYQRGQALKRNYNITVGEYESMLLSQNGLCAICGHPPKTKRLAVDHDHKTGLIRGLLCAFCNRAIGMFRDDVNKFETVVTYLKRPPATVSLGGERFGVKGRVSNKASTRRRLNKP